MDIGWVLKPLNHNRNSLLYGFFFFFFGLFLGPQSLHIEVPQARGQMGAAVSGLCHSHSNVRSKLRLRPTLQLLAMPDPDPLSEAGGPTASSWILVGFISIVPQQELSLVFLRKKITLGERELGRMQIPGWKFRHDGVLVTPSVALLSLGVDSASIQ